VRLDQTGSVLGGRGVYDVEPPIAAERHLSQGSNCHRGPRRCRKALLFGLPGAFPRIEDDGLHRVLPFQERDAPDGSTLASCC
jgi:hypothetical protein